MILDVCAKAGESRAAEGVVAASDSTASDNSIAALQSCLSLLDGFEKPWRPCGCDEILVSEILSGGMRRHGGDVSFGCQDGESRTVEGVPVVSDAGEAAFGDDGEGAQ